MSRKVRTRSSVAGLLTRIRTASSARREKLSGTAGLLALAMGRVLNVGLSLYSRLPAVTLMAVTPGAHWPSTASPLRLAQLMMLSYPPCGPPPPLRAARNPLRRVPVPPGS